MVPKLAGAIWWQKTNVSAGRKISLENLMVKGVVTMATPLVDEGYNNIMESMCEKREQKKKKEKKKTLFRYFPA